MLPTLRLLFYFYIYSLFCPLLNTHITLALHTSMHCSAVISVYTFQLCLFSTEKQRMRKCEMVIQKERKGSHFSLYVPRSLLSLPYLISPFVHSLHRSRPMCSLHLSPSPRAPSISFRPRAAIFSGRLTAPVKGLICILCMQV